MTLASSDKSKNDVIGEHRAVAIKVVAAVVFKADKCLITRNGPQKKHAGLWEFPGGKLLPHEDVPACAIREIHEELGLTIIPEQIICEVNHAYPEITIHLIAVRCHTEADPPQLTEHDAFQWVLPQELHLFDLTPADIPIRDELLKKSAAVHE